MISCLRERTLRNSKSFCRVKSVVCLVFLFLWASDCSSNRHCTLTHSTWKVCPQKSLADEAATYLWIQISDHILGKKSQLRDHLSLQINDRSLQRMTHSACCICAICLGRSRYHRGWCTSHCSAPTSHVLFRMCPSGDTIKQPCTPCTCFLCCVTLTILQRHGKHIICTENIFVTETTTL